MTNYYFYLLGGVGKLHPVSKQFNGARPRRAQPAKMARKLTFARPSDGGLEKAKCFYTSSLSYFYRSGGLLGTLFAHFEGWQS
jgi:hypothetical protein